MTTEARCSKRLLGALKIPGAQFDKMSDRYQVGIPDILGCYQGLFVAIEVKSNDGFVLPAEKTFAELPKGHGFSAMQRARLLAYKKARAASLGVVFLGSLVVVADAELITQEGTLIIPSNTLRQGLQGTSDVKKSMSASHYTCFSAGNDGEFQFNITALLSILVQIHKENFL